MRLWIVRHGATTAAGSKQFVGRADLPLSDEGRRQAEVTGDELRRRHFTAICASDLLRARDTAAIIAERQITPQTVQIEPDLSELHMGDWDGLDHSMAQARDPATYAAWQRDPAQVAPPNGETLRAAQTRVRAVLDRYLAIDPRGEILWVSHNMTIRILLCTLLDIDLVRWNLFRIANCALTEVELTTDETIIRCLNCTTHLRPKSGL